MKKKYCKIVLVMFFYCCKDPSMVLDNENEIRIRQKEFNYPF